MTSLSWRRTVGDQLFIRDVPQHVRSWIESERRQRMMTQKKFLIHALEQACAGSTQPTLFEDLANRPAAIPDSTPFNFIDLFAGISGIRIGLQRAGGQCVFSSEWDKNSQKTYRKWFGEVPHGDITEIKPNEIPNHDVLAAGFPCQPFSMM